MSSNPCIAGRSIGQYNVSAIDPCNPSKQIGTYAPSGGGGDCNCCDGLKEYRGYFTTQVTTINPNNIFSSGEFVACIFELFLESTAAVSSVPASAGDPQYKGSYYYYYINSTASKLNVISAQGGLNAGGLIQATDTSQISYSSGVGILINLKIPCYAGWKITHVK